MGTTTAPVVVMAKSTQLHSTRVLASRQTRWPGSMPRSMSPSAISRAACHISLNETSRHSPPTLCFWATRSPYIAAALGSRSAIVFDAVVGWDCRPASICPPRELLLVQRVEEVSVLLVDHVALDLQRRGQLAGLLGEVVVEDRELLDLGDLRVVGVDLVQAGLDELAHLVVLGELAHVGGQPLFLRPGDDLLLVERDQRDGERAAV